MQQPISTMLVSLVRQLVYAGGGLARVKMPEGVDVSAWEALLTGLGNRGLIVEADETDVYTIKTPERPPEVDPHLCRPIPQEFGTAIEIAIGKPRVVTSEVAALRAENIQPEGQVIRDVSVTHRLLELPALVEGRFPEPAKDAAPHPDQQRAGVLVTLECAVCGLRGSAEVTLTICGCGVALCPMHRDDPHGRARHRAMVPLFARQEGIYFNAGGED